jgi:hypothetical protein
VYMVFGLAFAQVHNGFQNLLYILHNSTKIIKLIVNYPILPVNNSSSKKE